jgi:hypothetical protein
MVAGIGKLLGGWIKQTRAADVADRRHTGALEVE